MYMDWMGKSRRKNYFYKRQETLFEFKLADVGHFIISSMLHTKTPGHIQCRKKEASNTPKHMSQCVDLLRQSKGT
jgi:hypothetical protein